MLWFVCKMSLWSGRVHKWQSWWSSEEVGLWLALTLLRDALLPGPWARWNVPQFPPSVFPIWTSWQWSLACCTSVLPILPGCRQGVCEHRPQTGVHSCAERDNKVAGLNLLSLFGRGGAGGVHWMQNFPLHLSSHGFTCSAKLLHALTTGIGGKGVWRVASLLKTRGSASAKEPDVLILLWPTDLQSAFRRQSTKAPLLCGCLDKGREEGNQAESFKHLFTCSCQDSFK